MQSESVADDRRKKRDIIDAMISFMPADSPMLREATDAMLRFQDDKLDGPSFMRGYVSGHLDGMNYDLRSLPMWQRKHVAEKVRILHALHRVLMNGGYAGDEYAGIMARLDKLRSAA